ncbi:MAG: hypothetical protein F6K08_33775 [Okeania sp. SIO1H6]|uniref:Uncharacterized protein n=1 Tax=Okeania hirsuta TaxID=1458930 RepID=A0A3N6NFQ8_9CYAN|nr:hypothetical protein [Okeania sp. SIO1H6]RQH10341.1 hypothetical protein D4Z78_28230 [Okeania hirsuta]RQH24036.1 hypothetical protein D5R40_30240 [Okeania hirsuta]
MKLPPDKSTILPLKASLLTLLAIIPLVSIHGHEKDVLTLISDRYILKSHKYNHSKQPPVKYQSQSQPVTESLKNAQTSAGWQK